MSAPRLALIGDQSLLVRCGESALEAGHVVVRVVTDDGEVRAWAAAHGIPVSSGDDGFAHGLAESAPFDWLLSITNLQIIPDTVLALPTRGTINFHDGPLPRYAGLNAPAWALLEGARRYAVTWHLVDRGLDTGPVLVEEPFEIDPAETAFTLNARCFEAGFTSWLRVLRLLAHERPPTHEQGDGGRRLYRRDDRPDGGGLLDFTEGAEAVARLTRALDFGPGYANPLTMPKLAAGNTVVGVRSAVPLEEASESAPGTVLRREGDRLVVATGDHDVELELAFGPRPEPGTSVLAPPPLVAAVGDALREAAPAEPFWVERLAEVVELDLATGLARAEQCGHEHVERPSDGSASELAVDLLLFVARWLGVERSSVALRTAETVEASDRAGAAVVDRVPVTFDIALDATVEESRAAAGAALAEALARPAYAADLRLREPALADALDPALLPVLVQLGVVATQDAPPAPLLVTLEDGRVAWEVDTARLGTGAAALLADRFAAFRHALRDGEPGARFGDLTVLADADLAVTCTDAARTLRAVDDACVHRLIEEQADRTPESVAVVDGDRSLTYRQLDGLANTLATLLHEEGVARGDRVGVHVGRSAEMLLTVLAALKVGAAYVPLDPTYPRERLAHMVSDSGCRVIVTTGDAVQLLGPTSEAAVVDLAGVALDPSARRPDVDVEPTDLAYVIYTSGSTGRPKGVMVEHRNVANFFAGMAEVVPPPRDRPERWLALTSLSFDISVLELLWPLTRGVTCVLGEAGEGRGGNGARTSPVGFSLFYFSSSADATEGERYRLLLEGARFADTHGFEAVWTPERHFHAFGGLFPNPSVTGAALATITSHVGIRGGSCVLPLHHPARVAEEWSVVDNLSGGRVGVAFASGWQPNDFVLAPERHATAKQAMVELLDTVRRLWRGEAVAFPGPKGDLIETSTLPRPIQPELPTWMTTAGNVQTFELAGSLGCNLLTHLLGQSVAEVGEKIAAYRAARATAGHEGPGRVTLMLHTLLGDDEDEVRDLAREPLKRYLSTAADLIKTFAWSFPTFANVPKESIGDELATLTDEEMDALLEFSFDRYYETSGLFGTVDRAAEMVDRVREIGVDELACLVDFGVDETTVLERLGHLDRLRARFADATAGAPGDDASVAALVARHDVTHLQCTPSRARLLLADDDSAAALASLDVLLVGGEAFPRQLAEDLGRQGAKGRVVLNMYGPTETTIWSTVDRVEDGDRAPALGAPIANTTLYVLDRYGELAAPGVAGELAIGGRGVVRGYHARPELTAERFVSDRFGHGGADARLYRTGDLVRRGVDGELEFLGRLDHQVKLRGYRIELAEIEHVLTDVTKADESVVVLAGDPGAERLVAYVASPTPVDETETRRRLEQLLPDYMVPGRIVPVAELPRTPNGKLDRAALPPPEQAAAASAAPVRFGSETEATVAAIWCSLLGRPSVGRDDNFFELGGHSLLVIQAHRRIVSELGVTIPLTDLFRFTTVTTLARHLDAEETAPVAQTSGRAAMQERRRQRRMAGS